MKRSSLFRRGNRRVTAVTRLLGGKRRRQRGWRKVRHGPLFRCGTCRKGFSNPLGHVCTNKNDFGKRKRAAARAATAAKRKQQRDERRRRVNERVARARARERDRAAGRLSATRRRERAKADVRVAKARAARKPPRRTRKPVHDYRNCRDHDCQRMACEAYREGVDDGMDAAGDGR